MNKKPPFFKRRAFFILLIAIFTLPIALRGASLAVKNNKNDVKAWLPDGFAETRELEWFRQHFLGEQFVVISWKGCTLDDPRVEMLAQKLVPTRGESPMVGDRRVFKSVTTGPRVLKQMTDPEGRLKLSRAEAVKRLQGSLIGRNGKTTCVVVTLTHDAVDDLRSVIGNARPLNEILMGRQDGLLYRIAEADCAIPQPNMLLGGPPVDNVAIDDEGEITLLRLVGLCGLLGLVLAWWCFRSARITMMVFCCGVYGAAASLAIVYVTRGQVDAVLMSMPSLIYVLGLSGAIHLVNYYKDSVREHGVDVAPGTALQLGWLPCTLAAVTTALGLGSLCVSEIIPIRKFGTYSAMGVLFTLVILFAVLPSVLELWPPVKRKKKNPQKEAAHAAFQKRWHDRLMGIGDWIIRRHMLVATTCSVLMVLFAIGLTKIETSVQLLKLFDGDADIITDYTWLEQNLGNLVPMEVVVRVDQSRMRSGSDPVLSEDGRYRLTFLERIEMVEQIQQNIERLPEVGRALAMPTFAPVLPAKTGGLATFAERSGYNAALERHRTDYLKEDYYRVTDEGEELFRISARVAALSDVDYGHFVGEIRETVAPVLAAYRQRDQILSSISAEGESLRGRRVCVIGVPRPDDAEETGDAPEALPAQQDAHEQSHAGLPTPKEVLSETLVDLLRVSGIRVTSIYQADEASPGEERIAGDAEHPKAAKYFGQFDAVFVAEDHPRVDYDFIARHAKHTINARQYDPLAVTTAEESQSGLSPVYTGIVPLVYKAQRTLLVGLIKSIGLAFVLICIVMIAILRSPTAGLFAMIPNAFPVVMIFGIMGWVGFLVDIGTMMTASVALGVAVDDTVHFLTWFRRGICQGLNRPGAVRLAYEKCATAMMQTTIIGGLGLGVFAFSTFTPTQRFGYLMMVLLAAAVIGDLVFLPAMLVGPAGKFFSARLKVKEPAKASPVAEATPSAVPAPHFPALPQQTGTTISSDVPPPFHH